MRMEGGVVHSFFGETVLPGKPPFVVQVFETKGLFVIIIGFPNCWGLAAVSKPHPAKLLAVNGALNRPGWAINRPCGPALLSPLR